MTYKPPFETTDAITNEIAEIAVKVGNVQAYQRLTRSPLLRRENRIKTIHSSLAIENNTLSLEQVSAVIDGKHVLAPPKDLLEVQNAIKVYESIDSYNPLSIADLLSAHKLMMGGLVDEAGRFRSGNVGVFDGEELVHAGTPAKYVPEVISNLFSWLEHTNTHPLIKSCVFHYEFVFIHPFADGNGRIGRLWQTLILSKWNAFFAWLPVETLVKEHQQEYYNALNSCNKVSDSTEFINFMLKMINSSLDSVLCELVKLQR